MELLQLLELTYGIWNLATEVIPSKINIYKIFEFDYARTMNSSMQVIVRKRKVLQRGGIKEFIWECSAEIVVAGSELSQPGAITKPWGNGATEFVETEFKHGEG